MEGDRAPAVAPAQVGRFKARSATARDSCCRPDEATRCSTRTRANAEVVRPYLSGEDLNRAPMGRRRGGSSISATGRRNARASIRAPFARVEQLVTPERERDEPTRSAPSSSGGNSGERAPDLYRRDFAALSGASRSLASARSCSRCSVPTGHVVSHTLVVFAYDDDAPFRPALERVSLVVGRHPRSTLRDRHPLHADRLLRDVRPAGADRGVGDLGGKPACSTVPPDARPPGGANEDIQPRASIPTRRRDDIARCARSTSRSTTPCATHTAGMISISVTTSTRRSSARGSRSRRAAPGGARPAARAQPRALRGGGPARPARQGEGEGASAKPAPAGAMTLGFDGV